MAYTKFKTSEQELEELRMRNVKSIHEKCIKAGCGWLIEAKDESYHYCFLQERSRIVRTPVKTARCPISGIKE